MSGSSNGMLFGGDVYKNIKWIIRELKCQRDNSAPVVFYPVILPPLPNETNVLQETATLINALSFTDYPTNTIPVFFTEGATVTYVISIQNPGIGPTQFGQNSSNLVGEEDLFILAENITDLEEFTTYINTNLVPETIGGYIEGEPITPPEGVTQKEFNDKFFQDIILPSVSFNVTNEIIEKGSNYFKSIVTTFNQNDAGNLLGISIEKDGTEVGTTTPFLFSANEVLSSFTLQSKVSHDASSDLLAGQVSTSLKTITPVDPQWKGQKNSNTSFDNSTYTQFNSSLNKFIQSNDNTSLTVLEGNYGFFISINPNATIISAETNLPLAEGSAYQKNTITAKLVNGDNVTLTEYIINPATGDFTYNLE